MCIPHACGGGPRAKIELEEIKRDRRKIVMLVKDNSIFQVFPKHLDNLAGAVVIYSMWEGYLDRSNLRETLKQKGIELKIVHTSGHVTERGLQRLAEAFESKCLVPIGIFQPQDYVSLFHNVHMLNDGEEFVI